MLKQACRDHAVCPVGEAFIIEGTHNHVNSYIKTCKCQVEKWKSPCSSKKVCLCSRMILVLNYMYLILGVKVE